jgi:hypothetical protein
MNILFLYAQLRASGISFLRSHYFLEDIKDRGHKIELAHFIHDINLVPEELRKDAFSYDDVINFQPDVLIFEQSNINRYPSRDWIKEIKKKGCIVVHCGLNVNDYSQNKDRYDTFFRDAGFEIYNGSEKYIPPTIRGKSLGDQTSRTDVDTLKRYCSIRDSRIFENVPWVESSLALVIDLSSAFGVLINAGLNSQIKAYDSDRHGEGYAVYGAFNDFEGIEILITGHFVTDGDTEAERKHNRTFLINVLEHLYERHPLKFQITKLLDQLAETYPNSTEVTVPAIQEIKRDPTFRNRLINALKLGGVEALKSLFNHPVVSVSVETIKGFLEAEAE